jgi:hypothetical protein
VSDIINRLRQIQESWAESIKRLDSSEFDTGIMGQIRAEQHATFKEAADRIAELEAALAEAQSDAVRYRWLRQRDNAKAVEIVMTVFEPDALDAAVDAAMQEGER